MEEIQASLLEVTTRVDSIIVHTGRTEELSATQSELQKIEDLVQGVKEDLSVITEKKVEKRELNTVEDCLEYAQLVLKKARILVQNVEGNLDMTSIGGSR